MPTDPKAVKRARRSAKRRGKAFEDWVAARMSEVWPGCSARKRNDWGKKQSDITDDATPVTVECKKRTGWMSQGLEDALEQANGYAHEYVDPKIPIVVNGDSPGPGRPQSARVYMDFENWLQREGYVRELECELAELKRGLAS